MPIVTPLESVVSWAVLVLIAPIAIRAWDCGRLFDRALDDVHVSRKVAAAAMGWNEKQLARAIAGCGPEHFSFDRMTQLPRDVWGALLVEIATVYQFVPSAETRANRLTRVATRMVQASLRRDTRQEVTRASVA